jgi:hypothetical protein
MLLKRAWVAGETGLMSRLEVFARNVQAVLVTAVVAGLDFLQHYLDSVVTQKTAWDTALGAGILLFILFIVVQVIQFAVESTVESSAILRKFVMGRDYIEGTWKNVVRHPKKHDEMTGGIIQITMINGKLRLRGETFDGKGVRIGIFSSVMAEYEEADSSLKYTFVKTDIMSDRNLWDGYSEYRFNILDKHRKIFDGVYTFKGAADEFRLRGELMSKTEERKARTEDGRRDIVVSYIARERKMLGQD